MCSATVLKSTKSRQMWKSSQKFNHKNGGMLGLPEVGLKADTTLMP